MKFDLHIHSKYSQDGVLEPKAIVEIAASKGLKGIAITDHNTIKGALKARNYGKKDFEVIVGSEIVTQRGEITGLFLQNEIVSRDFYEVIEEIKRQNGIVVVPHPFDRLRKSTFTPTSRDIKFIDCVEVYNSRCVFQKYNNEALSFAIQHRLKMVAGSDAHFRSEIGNAGIEVSESCEDLKKIILSGKARVFGRKSSLLNHVFTKTIKWLGKRK